MELRPPGLEKLGRWKPIGFRKPDSLSFFTSSTRVNDELESTGNLCERNGDFVSLLVSCGFLNRGNFNTLLLLLDGPEESLFS